MQWLERGSRDAHLRPSAFCPNVSVVRVSFVLQYILEKNVVDDFIGKPLDPIRVTSAKLRCTGGKFGWKDQWTIAIEILLSRLSQ